MATTFELSISPTYVEAWQFTDAIRELFQNAIDQEIINSANKMTWSYDAEAETLCIGSTDSCLERHSLLLGGSTKSEDNKTIGKFGEGYKLALLVLTRLGHGVKVFNYQKREMWEPEISKSSKYKTEVLKVLVHKYIFKSLPDANLVFQVSGVTEGLMEQVRATNLFTNPVDRAIETKYGRILLDPLQSGRVYVKGLYVSTPMSNKENSLTYGYDFNPEHITLDRDRRLVKDFELSWATSRMWINSEPTPEAVQIVTELVKAGSPEVTFVSSHMRGSSYTFSEHAHLDFIKEHGNKAIPVCSQAEVEELEKKKFKPIIVTESHRYLIKSSPSYSMPVSKTSTRRAADKEFTPREHLAKLVRRLKKKMSDSEYKAATDLVDMAQDWRWK